jgi:hypothetical protein
MDRLHVIKLVLEKRLTGVEAAARLNISDRQVRRVCTRVREEGHRGVLHKSKGRPSNRKLDDELLSQAIGAVHDELWEGFKPTFAREKLFQFYGLRIGLETLRKTMIATGAWHGRRRGARHRAWRPRRPCVGLLVQLDGSPHDWFEGRGPRCTLLVFIDDATSLIQYAVFVDSEDTLNLMRAMKVYLDRFGRPVALYVDKDSIYRVNKHYEDEADRPATQFARGMAELGVEVIWAHSPQAKGRVERGFETHQDRLVKELRLAGISTMEAANEFLRKVYIPDHNARCAVAPAEAGDAHRPLRASHRLDEILSMRETRRVDNDFTVRFESKWFQLLADRALRLKPKDKVEVERRLDGSLHMRAKGRYVPFKTLGKRPYRPFYAHRKPEAAWPTKDEVRGRTRTENPRKEWLWGWRERKSYKSDVNDDTSVPGAEAFI